MNDGPGHRDTPAQRSPEDLAEAGPFGSEPLTDGPPTQGRPVPPSPDPARPRSNGLFVGPAAAPDSYELFGDGLTGGEGITWRARYRGGLDVPVMLAVKMLNRPAGAGPAWPAPQDVQRWQDQAVLLRTLRLEHVVRVHDIFTGPPPHARDTPADGGTVAYIVMEWLEGPTLEDVVGGAPATPATLGARMTHVADLTEALAGMHSLHGSGGNPTLHRDVKPGNCIVTEDRGLVLIDISTMRGVADAFDQSGLHTRGFTAPEVLRDVHAARSPSADLYALGAVAAYCLLGSAPPAPGADGHLVRRHLEDAAHDAGAPEPAALAEHIMTMLRSDPRSRPWNVERWAHTLVTLAGPAVVAEPPGGGAGVPQRRPAERRVAPPAARRGRAVLLGAAAAVLAVVVVMLMRLPGWRATDADPPATTPTTAAAAAAATATSSAGPSGGPTSTAAPAPPVSTTAAATRTSAAVTTRSSGAFASPEDGASVLSCAYFTGTAHLASGKTLVLAMRNLDNGDNARYVEYVFGWDNPAALDSWRGAQYFNGAPGQHYRVELVVVDLSAAQAARAGGSDAVNALAAQGSAVASRVVVRTSGTAPDDCPGP